MFLRSSKSLICGVLLCALVFFVSGSYLVRPLWFDEALTVQNFALLDSVQSIYFNYVIPNNQLLYTMLLHFWLKAYCGLGGIDDWMRLLTLLLAGITMVYAWRRFRVAFGSGVMAVVLITFCCAPPFLLHATALRGYMAGACFTLLALGAALDYTSSGKVYAWGRYFFFCYVLLQSCLLICWLWGVSAFTPFLSVETPSGKTNAFIFLFSPLLPLGSFFICPYCLSFFR